MVFKVDPISPTGKDARHYCFYVPSIQIIWQYSRGFLWPHRSLMAETERADAIFFLLFLFCPFFLPISLCKMTSFFLFFHAVSPLVPLLYDCVYVE